MRNQQQDLSNTQKYINTAFQNKANNMKPQQKNYSAAKCNKGKGNFASLICVSKKCSENAFICQQSSCECRVIHKNCFLISLAQFTQKMQNQILDVNSYIDLYNKKVDDFINTIIKETSKMKEQFKKMSQEKLTYSLLSQNQRVILVKLKQNNFIDMSGQQCHSLLMEMNQLTNLIPQNLQQRQLQQITKMFQVCKHNYRKQLQCLSKQLNDSIFLHKQYSAIKQDGIISRYRFEYVNKISSILQGKNDCQNLYKLFQPLRVKSLKLLFKASQHYFLASQFHKKCDGIQHTLTLVKTNYDQVIGGYTKCKWQSINGEGSYASDADGTSFLFSLTHFFKLKNKKIQTTILNKSSYGPVFGGGYDLCIGNTSNIGQRCWATNIGNTYQNEEIYPRQQHKAWKKFQGVDHSHFATKQYEVYAVIFE